MQSWEVEFIYGSDGNPDHFSLAFPTLTASLGIINSSSSSWVRKADSSDFGTGNEACDVLPKRLTMNRDHSQALVFMRISPPSYYCKPVCNSNQHWLNPIWITLPATKDTLCLPGRDELEFYITVWSQTHTDRRSESQVPQCVNTKIV